MSSGSKRYLYEKARKPSTNKGSDVDVLYIWCADSQNKDLSINTGNEAKARKAYTIFHHLTSAILDPAQIHLRAVLYKMVETYKDSDEVMKSMLKSLQSNPPTLSLFKFSQNDSSMGFTDMNLKDYIFICDKLSSALENSDDNSPLGIRLKFLVFNTLWHELAHWLHHDPDIRKYSGTDQRWRDFFGNNVSSGSDKDKRQGEAGYFVEGMMWGGIITFALPFRPYGQRDPVPGLYQRQMSSIDSARPWNDVALVLRQTGDFTDLDRDDISLNAMAKRLIPGAVVTPFTADELTPLYVLQKQGGKIGWTLKDPTETEGETRTRKRRKINYRERSEQGLTIPDHINVLYAIEEHVVIESGEFIIVEEQD